MVVPQRFGLIINWVDKVSLLFGRSERWYFVSISIFRLSVLPWATNCHVFNKIIGMLKRQIIGSKHGFLRITNILEGNSRLVFTQFRLFRWLGSQAKGASDKFWLLEWMFASFGIFLEEFDCHLF